MKNQQYSQPIRTLLFLVYVFLIFLTNRLVFGQWLPFASGKGLWFYTGLASLLLGNYLVTPYFIKPVDAISYSVVSIIALYAVNEIGGWDVFENILYYILLIYFLIIVVISFLQIILKDSKSEITQRWSNTFRVILEDFGRPNLIFSPLIVFSIIVFHRDSPKEVIGVFLAWLIVVIIRPDEFIFGLYIRMSEIWSEIQTLSVYGKLEAIQSPNLVLISPKEKIVNSGSIFLIKNANAYTTMGIGLDCIGFGDSRYLRVFEFEIPQGFKARALKSAKMLPENRVAKFGNPEEFKEGVDLLERLKNLIGIVSTDTSIERLYFEVLKEEYLEAGCLIQVKVKNQIVVYQVLDGYTKEEIVYQKTTHGFIRAQAQQIGIRDTNEDRFIPAKWVPQINTPVFLVITQEYKTKINDIGHFPFSDYSVSIKSINQLVTHNTAILGILGVGKTMLAIEIVERIMTDKIKVLCLDLTDQYSDELKDFYDREVESATIAKLKRIGEEGKGKVEQNVEEGGSVKEFAEAIRSEITQFLKTDDPRMLKIFNPSEFQVWRQDSKLFKNNASMASLTPTEITQIFSDAVLSVCQDMGMTDRARVCIVYEEAHALVPEWSSVAAEGDKSATSGTARAILQGRKFGLGCLLVTQRTANVTKTILNQCNTVFAMRTFDDTGKTFLSNYLGTTYSNLLPNLREREAVFYGRASSCENPVLIRLNDREDFLGAFRKEYPPPELQSSHPEEKPERELSMDEDDEIPF